MQINLTGSTFHLGFGSLRWYFSNGWIAAPSYLKVHFPLTRLWPKVSSFAYDGDYGNLWFSDLSTFIIKWNNVANSELHLCISIQKKFWLLLTYKYVHNKVLFSVMSCLLGDSRLTQYKLPPFLHCVTKWRISEELQICSSGDIKRAIEKEMEQGLYNEELVREEFHQVKKCSQSKKYFYLWLWTGNSLIRGCGKHVISDNGPCL